MDIPTVTQAVIPQVIPTLIIELSVFGAVGWLAWNAYHQGHRWLATLLWGIVFGFFVEWWNISHPPCPYGYPLTSLPYTPLAIAGVPVWVPIGWGGILYASAWSAQRLELPLLARPVAAALLAVNVDLSLDPVAQSLGFWHWHGIAVVFCGVPFDNFLAWYLVVFIYTFSARWLFRLARLVLARLGDSRTEREVVWIQYAGPFVSAVLACATYLAVKWALGTTAYGQDDGTIAGLTFVGVTVFAAGVTWALATGPHRGRNQDEVNWPVILVPAAIHTISFGLFLIFCKTWRDQAALLAAIPTNLIAGFFMYALPSLGAFLGWEARRRGMTTDQLRTISRYPKPKHSSSVAYAKLSELPVRDPSRRGVVGGDAEGKARHG